MKRISHMMINLGHVPREKLEDALQKMTDLAEAMARGYDVTCTSCKAPSELSEWSRYPRHGNCPDCDSKWTNEWLPEPFDVLRKALFGDLHDENINRVKRILLDKGEAFEVMHSALHGRTEIVTRNSSIAFLHDVPWFEVDGYSMTRFEMALQKFTRSL